MMKKNWRYLNLFLFIETTSSKVESAVRAYEIYQSILIFYQIIKLSEILVQCTTYNLVVLCAQTCYKQ